jgi:hypothetical protein
MIQRFRHRDSEVAKYKWLFSEMGMLDLTRYVIYAAIWDLYAV